MGANWIGIRILDGMGKDPGAFAGSFVAWAPAPPPRRAAESEDSVWKTGEGSTGRLIQLCIGYFFFYVITGVTVKYFLGKPALGLPGMTGTQFLVYSTAGGTFLATGVVLVWRWYRLQSIRPVKVGGHLIPSELFYIIPSGIMTAVVIPTTTLMYTLPISVMVAMVIMRGSVILIGRVVDAIQIRQGLLDKKVYWQENVAVLFAIAAVAMNTVFAHDKNGFEFIHNRAAMIIFFSYIGAYSVRIYIMNYYKNTRGKGKKLNNKAFFGIEQISSTVTLIIAGFLVYKSPTLFGWSGEVIDQFRGAIAHPLPQWPGAILAGMAFGAVAFFSVFLFMFKGRTATFAGLVNRLTSLIAGTVATLLFGLFWSGKYPSVDDWISLLLIFIAIYFLSGSEQRRVRELKAAHEIEAAAKSTA